MEFSEALNAAFSTASVLNEANQRVDQQDAHVSSSDAREIDLTLSPNLPPGVYVVIWRAVSNDDGHSVPGAFRFTIARPDGSVPSLGGGSLPGQNIPGSGTLSGQFDGLTLFNLIVVTLVELGAVFWVGASLWHLFVLKRSTEKHAELSALHQQVQRGFERRLSLPTLLVVLLGQAFSVTGGRWETAFAPPLLVSLVTSGRFGTFWLLRELVLAVATGLSLYSWQVQRRPPLVRRFLPRTNLLLGLLLFAAIALSGHAAAESLD